jgi:SAM-dependent methyltransferase
MSAYDESYVHFERLKASGRFSVAWWSARFYARLIRRYVKKGRLLEIGCAFGQILALLASDFEVHGLDISEYAIRLARQRVPQARLTVGDASALGGYPTGAFDVVLAKHVLEHLSDPSSALRECARVLRPDGVLVYGTPNADSPLRKWKGEKWIGVVDPTHVSVLRPPEWLRLTAAAGLRAVKVFCDGFWDVPYLPLLPAALQLPLFAGPVALQVLSGVPLIPVPWGESLIVVARKRVEPNGQDGLAGPEVGRSSLPAKGEKTRSCVNVS